MEGLIREIK